MLLLGGWELVSNKGTRLEMPKKSILEDGFLDSTYRGHIPNIVNATAKFPISRYRDNRDLSVCLPHLAVFQVIFPGYNM